jgi:two-component system sensor histidine kinase/response regulator
MQDHLKFTSVLIDIIPYPIFYKGADTRFIGFNKAYEDIFKIKRADLIGKRVLDLEYLTMEDRINYQKEDEDVIQNSSELQKEMPIPFADGKIHDTL